MKALLIAITMGFIVNTGQAEIIPIPIIKCDDKVELEFDGEGARVLKILNNGYSFRETVDKDNSGNELILLPPKNQVLTGKGVFKLSSPAGHQPNWRIDIQTGIFEPVKTQLIYKGQKIIVTCQFGYEKREI